MEAEAKPEATPTRRDFQIPGCETIIQSGDRPIAISELVSLMFQIAGANPDSKVDFSIRIKQP